MALLELFHIVMVIVTYRFTCVVRITLDALLNIILYSFEPYAMKGTFYRSVTTMEVAGLRFISNFLFLFFSNHIL